MSGGTTLPTGGLPGGWLKFTRWSSGRLAASHLQGPATLMTQLDHLLSLVPDNVQDISGCERSFGRSGQLFISSGGASGPMAPMASR